MKKIVIYTAASDNVTVLSPPSCWRDQADFVVFQDHLAAPEGWDRRPLDHKSDDPIRNIIRHKILAHEYFPSAEYTLWIDPSIQLNSTLTLERWISESLGSLELAAFKHPERNSCYTEAIFCIEKRLDSTQVIDRQMQGYKNTGYPPKNGLADCRVLLRRHTPKIRRFNDLWYKEVLEHSHCEQLSFDFVAHLAAVEYVRLPGALLDNSHFELRPVNQPVHAGVLNPCTVVKDFQKPDAIILAHPRSGTHFLLACLASHPRIFPRGEFLVSYAKFGSSEYANLLGVKQHLYTNKPGYFNVGIVMYENIPTYLKLFGASVDTKIIHLLRNAENVARSVSQLEADRMHYQNKVQKHITREQKLLPHVAITMKVINVLREQMYIKPQFRQFIKLKKPSSLEAGIADIKRFIEHAQTRNSQMLSAYPHKFVVNYDELTGNAQVNELPKAFCTEILNFLGLDYHPLVNNLKKTG